MIEVPQCDRSRVGYIEAYRGVTLSLLHLLARASFLGSGWLRYSKEVDMISSWLI